MTIAILVLVTVMLLVGSGSLMLTIGHRRTRPRALAAGELATLERRVGRELAQLVADAIQLIAEAEDVVKIGHAMSIVEGHLVGATHRPLWRQMDDANFKYELDDLRRSAQDWVETFDTLDVAERQLLEHLGVEIEPVRALALDCSWFEPSIRRTGELEFVQSQIDAAIACLRKIEREISSYRGGGYR